MFFTFSIKDFIDILLVSLMLFYFFKLMRESGSLNVFFGILVFIVTWLLVSQVLEMKLLGSIFDKLVSVGVIALFIIFQDEIRKFLYTLGTHRRIENLVKFLSGSRKKKVDHTDILPIVLACMSMSKKKVGALIIMERTYPLTEIAKSGEMINANVNQLLIENIFFKNSPLHDGAMIISHGRIEAAGCILPVSHNQDIPKELGLRHRAALGISQETDAIAVVVSEETGGISIARHGHFRLRVTSEELERALVED